MTFNEAFAQARKQGLDKFQWNGKWYGTKLASEVKSSTVSHVKKGNSQQKYSAPVKGTDKNGRIITVGAQTKDRYTIRRVNGNQYGIYDNQDQNFVGKSFDSLQSAQNYAKSGEFKNRTSEIVVTGSQRKIDKNTSGYIPVEGTHTNARGDSRVFKNYETGQYKVVDNYGNVIADAYDPNAANKDFQGWVINTGTTQDIQRAQAGQARNEANLNEQNQLSQQERDRQISERRFQLKGIQDFQGMANFAQSMINMPNHAITGAVRAAISPNYSLQDYLHGFGMDAAWNGEQQVGLGDILEVQDPYAKTALNFVNPLSVIGTSPRAIKVRGKSYSITRPTHNLDAHPTTVVDGKAADLQTVLVRNPQNGQFVGQARSSTWPIQNGTRTGNNNYSVIRWERPQMTSTGNGASAQTNASSQFPQRTQYNTVNYTTERPGTITTVIPGQTSTRLVFNGTFPYNALFRKDPVNYTIVRDDSNPTANFYYTPGYNNTVQRRIVLGDFDPATVGSEWTGDYNGGQVVVNNLDGTRLQMPVFQGTTSGRGTDNESNVYLYQEHKQGGKLVKRNSVIKNFKQKYYANI